MFPSVEHILGTSLRLGDVPFLLGNIPTTLGIIYISLDNNIYIGDIPYIGEHPSDSRNITLFSKTYYLQSKDIL